MPLSTLRLKPRGVNRKTQGQDGVRSLLSCKALSSSTTCRFIPAHPQTVFAPVPFRFYKKGCQEKKLSRELEAAKVFGIQPPYYCAGSSRRIARAWFRR